jgi:hypothetical protein
LSPRTCLGGRALDASRNEFSRPVFRGTEVPIMRKMVIALGLFTALMIATPRSASAHIGISIGLPGFGLAIGLPTPPIFVAPPVAYGPTYYAPAYSTYYGGYGGYPGYYGGGYYGHAYYGRSSYYGRPSSHRGYGRAGWRY